MTIREDFDYTFVDPQGVTLCLEAREGQSISLQLFAPSGQAISLHPTREQWLEFRATLNHVLDGEDVTALSTVKAKDSESPFRREIPVELLKLPPNTPEQKATFKRWLDKQWLDDTDLNDPPEKA